MAKEGMQRLLGEGGGAARTRPNQVCANYRKGPETIVALCFDFCR